MNFDYSGNNNHNQYYLYRPLFCDFPPSLFGVSQVNEINCTDLLF